MKIKVVPVFMLMFLLGALAVVLAAGPWSVLKNDRPASSGNRLQADNQAQMAINLAHEAERLLSQSKSEGSLKAAMALYSQAGQLFEKSANDYQALVAQGGAAKEDVDNAISGMRTCVKAIQDIKLHYR